MGNFVTFFKIAFNNNTSYNDKDSIEFDERDNESDDEHEHEHDICRKINSGSTFENNSKEKIELNMLRK